MVNASSVHSTNNTSNWKIELSGRTQNMYRIEELWMPASTRMSGLARDIIPGSTDVQRSSTGFPPSDEALTSYVSHFLARSSEQDVFESGIDRSKVYDCNRDSWNPAFQPMLGTTNGMTSALPGFEQMDNSASEYGYKLVNPLLMSEDFVYSPPNQDHMSIIQEPSKNSGTINLWNDPMPSASPDIGLSAVSEGVVVPPSGQSQCPYHRPIMSELGVDFRSFFGCYPDPAHICTCSDSGVEQVDLFSLEYPYEIDDSQFGSAPVVISQPETPGTSAGNRTPVKEMKLKTKPRTTPRTPKRTSPANAKPKSSQPKPVVPRPRKKQQKKSEIAVVPKDDDQSPEKDDSRHYCLECGRSFKDRHALGVHLRTHTGSRPYACDLCPYRATQKAHLEKHKSSNVHNKPKLRKGPWNSYESGLDNS